MSTSILQGPKLSSPPHNQTLGHLFFESLNKNSQKVFQIDGHTGDKQTYSNVKEKSVRVGLSLLAKGVNSKDVIFFCVNNTLESTIPYIASIFLGTKVVHTHYSFSSAATQHLISLVTPKIIFVQESYVSLIESSLGELKPEIIVLGSSDKYETLDNMLLAKTDEKNFRPLDVDLDDTIVILFSSGTTGLPKAICHTHSSILHIIATQQTYHSKVGLNFTTPYWFSGMIMLANSILNGYCRICCQYMKVEETFEMIASFRITTLFLSPISSYAFTDYPEDKHFDTSSVDAVIVSGTTIIPEQLAKIQNIFKKASVLYAYASSEAGIITMFDPEKDKKLIETKKNSCGKPVANFSVKIVNGDEIQPSNKSGEIFVKSPSLAKKYYTNIQGDLIFENDGFFNTKDIGYYDNEGCLYVTGRTREMFKYKSWHVVPSFLESVLLKHPAIKQAVVFGIPQGIEGEVPAACVVLRENYPKPAELDVITFTEKFLSDHERLRGGLKFVGELPLTPTEKVKRSAAKDLFMKTA